MFGQQEPSVSYRRPLERGGKATTSASCSTRSVLAVWNQSPLCFSFFLNFFVWHRVRGSISGPGWNSRNQEIRTWSPPTHITLSIRRGKARASGETSQTRWAYAQMFTATLPRCALMVREQTPLQLLRANSTATVRVAKWHANLPALGW